jgi:hypothetical protein
MTTRKILLIIVGSAILLILLLDVLNYHLTPGPINLPTWSLH